MSVPVFFFNETATTEIYTLSLHDALPISFGIRPLGSVAAFGTPGRLANPGRSGTPSGPLAPGTDRKSTRLNSSHTVISYAVFCLKKKKKNKKTNQTEQKDTQHYTLTQ